jgi:hypothetical protein
MNLSINTQDDIKTDAIVSTFPHAPDFQYALLLNDFTCF